MPLKINILKKTIVRLLLLNVFALCSVNLSAQVFFDDFKKPQVDTTLWTIVDRIWGEVGTHGGVVPQNISTKKGRLVVRGLGSQYKGPVKGHGQNTRVGGVVLTKKKYASGRYEVRAKICPHPGALSAFWTYYYENDEYNHEIDFEFPGHNQKPNQPSDSDIGWGLLSNWRGVGDSLHNTADIYFGNHVDGRFHTYRFDWHTGSDSQKPRVEWYFDGKLIHTSYTHIPTRSSEFNVGIWFPTWILPANFAEAFMYVDWVKITPFNEKNDDTY